MATLGAVARLQITSAGIPISEWMRAYGGQNGQWHGDRCGCMDDRCANGFHHEGPNDCGCLPTMIDDLIRWRRATKDTNYVELVGADYGLNQWVDVSTPAVRVSVSTSRGWTYPPLNGVARTNPASTSVRVETRKGWTSVVSQEVNKTTGADELVIRFVQDAPAVAEQESDKC